MICVDSASACYERPVRTPSGNTVPAGANAQVPEHVPLSYESGSPTLHQPGESAPLPSSLAAVPLFPRGVRDSPPPMVAPKWASRMQDRVRAGLAHPIYGYLLWPLVALAWLILWTYRIACLIVLFIPMAIVVTVFLWQM